MASELEAAAQRLPMVSARAVAEYERRLDALLLEVGREMATYPAILPLIGHGPMSEIFEFNRLHARFMRAVLRFGDTLLLVRGHTWFVRAYQARGFWRNFFPMAMRAWAKAVLAQMDPATGGEVARVYAFLVERHALFADEDRSAGGDARGDDGGATSDTFLEALFSGDEALCLRIARDVAARPGGLAGLYEGVIRPAMRTIGERWEAGKLDGSAERIASGIVERVVHVAGAEAVARRPALGAGAVVACAPEERHVIGARMVADLLFADGWDVLYLGAGASPAELLTLLRSRGSALLALSATMPAHLVGARDVISSLRAVTALSHVRIIVGGAALETVSESTMRSLDVDGWARDAAGAVRLASRWSVSSGVAEVATTGLRPRHGQRVA